MKVGARPGHPSGLECLPSLPCKISSHDAQLIKGGLHLMVEPPEVRSMEELALYAPPKVTL